MMMMMIRGVKKCYHKHNINNNKEKENKNRSEKA